MESSKGSVARLRLGTNLVLEPLRRTRAFERLELATAGTYWNDLDHTKAFSRGPHDHRLWTVALRYFLDKDRKSSIGLIRINGEDPVESLPLQKTTRLTFEFNVSQPNKK